MNTVSQLGVLAARQYIKAAMAGAASGLPKLPSQFSTSALQAKAPAAVADPSAFFGNRTGVQPRMGARQQLWNIQNAQAKARAPQPVATPEMRDLARSAASADGSHYSYRELPDTRRPNGDPSIPEWARHSRAGMQAHPSLFAGMTPAESTARGSQMADIRELQNKSRNTRAMLQEGYRTVDGPWFKRRTAGGPMVLEPEREMSEAKLPTDEDWRAHREWELPQQMQKAKARWDGARD